jgi:tRNA nucleotidyltransferase (CCA-adding enzyme)
MKILNMGPGPEVGRVLQDLMEKVIDHPELNTKEGLVTLVRKMKGSLERKDVNP